MDDITIRQVQLYRYEIPFTTPMNTGRSLLLSRKGLILRVEDTGGRTGYGEIAPLEGFSCESFADAESQALLLLEHLPHIPTRDILMQSLVFLNALPGTVLFPSVIFGFETAVHDLFENLIVETAPEMSSESGFLQVPVNALLNTNLPRERQQDCLAELLKQGFKAIKIKVGRQAVHKDIETVCRLSQHLPAGTTLRLDANRLWDFDTAALFAESIKGVPVEYIEEPFKDTATFSRIPEFYRETGLAVALDESLHSEEDANRFLELLPAGVHALILKPTLLGGKKRTRAFIEAASSRAIKPVISSSFEAGPAVTACAAMADAIDFIDNTAGLDTLKNLKSHLFAAPVVIRDGALRIDRSNRPHLYALQQLEILKKIQW
jgi:o-succinylbenzoate synthase